ncbi:MAG: ABC transporter permease subunit [Candidatus Thermoplasmatota archaeon]|nr:ABC transporter permease subunit [Candidatus Thermoplasmatota archaeon]
MIELESILEKANQRWNRYEVWHPLIIALTLVVIIAILHKVHWETTTETNPQEVWDSQTTLVDLDQGENQDLDLWTIDFEQDVGDEIVFKGVLETSPRYEVYRDITTGIFVESEALVYTDDLYGKTMLNIDGMRILVNGDLSGKFRESEIITIKAQLVQNTTTFQNGQQNVTLIREGWEAEPGDIKSADDIDYYFFGIECLILLIGTYLSIKNIDRVRNQLQLIWHIAKFEFARGAKSSRMIVLGLFFSLFIIGMGWSLGGLQNSDATSIFHVSDEEEALQTLAFFTFFVASLPAIAISVDSFHKERQANTLNMLLARPIGREAIVIGKALGLTLVVGVPAFVAQLIGLYFMTVEGDMPPISGMVAFLLFGQIMIFTIVSLQLCLAVAARSGSDVVLYGLGTWLLFALVWTLLLYAVSFVIGIELTEGFEADPEYQALASYLGLFNPGYVYQFAVGLMTQRTIAVDMGGIPGWLVLLALVLWPLTCLRVSTWLFKREMKG